MESIRHIEGYYRLFIIYRLLLFSHSLGGYNEMAFYAD